MTALPPVPDGGANPGTGPTPDPLIALAERWETWACEASTVAAHLDDEAGRAHLRAQAERAIADATDLRNLATDLKETS